MPHDLFDKRPFERKPPPAPNAVISVIDDLGSFGWLTSDGARAVMIEVRHANGLIRAQSYSWLESAEFNPSEGITLNFSGTKVKLIGRNLNAESRPGVRLFEGLLRHRVVWIQEADESMERESLETDVVIGNVTVSQ